jgi:hypothetical protein
MPKPVVNDGCIDETVFSQILELDDGDDMFSKGIIDAYYEQAEKIFTDMDDALCALAPFPFFPDIPIGRLGRGGILQRCLT